MPNRPSQKYAPKHSKGINKITPRDLIIKALEKRKWVMLVGGNSKDRGSLIKDVIDKTVKRDVRYAIEKSYREKNDDKIKKLIKESGKVKVNKKIREIVEDKFKDVFRCVVFKEKTTYFLKSGKTIARLIEKDLKGHNDVQMKELLFGNIDYSSFGELVCLWYEKRKEGEKPGLFFLLEHDTNNTLFLNNLNCKYIQTIEYIQVFLEYMRLSEGGLSPDFLQGKLIIGIKSDDRKLLPEDGFEDVFEVVTLDNDMAKKEKESRQRISDKRFKQLCKEVEEEIGTRKSLDEKIFFKQVEKKSKQLKYDKLGRGYTMLVAKKRYYEVFPSKKSNQ